MIGKILDDLGVDYTESSNDFIISCPLHSDSHPSFRIDKDSGFYHCFSCGEKGTLIGLIMLLTGESYIDVVGYLRKYSTKINSFFSGTDIDSLKKRIIGRKSNSNKSSSKDIKDPVLLPSKPITSNSYLSGRGFTPEEISFWNMSVVTGKDFTGWIQIPIVKDGVLRTYFLRDPKYSGKMYGFYKEIDESDEEKIIGYPRRDILFGMDDCIYPNKVIAVSEGIFDTIYNKRIISQSVAALSNKLLPEQLDFLSKFKTIYIIPDNDERGLHLVQSIIPLSIKSDIFVIQLPTNRKDSASCTTEELKSCIYRPIKLVDFLVSYRYLEFIMSINRRQIRKKYYKDSKK